MIIIHTASFRLKTDAISDVYLHDSHHKIFPNIMSLWKAVFMVILLEDYTLIDTDYSCIVYFLL